MEHIEYEYTRGMDDDEIDERLRTSETGVLSLSREGDAYAIPLAHYYDEDGLYFRVGMTEGSRKRAFFETTETACYVLYGTEPIDEPHRGLTRGALLPRGNSSGFRRRNMTDSIRLKSTAASPRFVCLTRGSRRSRSRLSNSTLT